MEEVHTEAIHQELLVALVAQVVVLVGITIMQEHFLAALEQLTKVIVEETQLRHTILAEGGAQAHQETILQISQTAVLED